MSQEDEDIFSWGNINEMNFGENESKLAAENEKTSSNKPNKEKETTNENRTKPTTKFAESTKISTNSKDEPEETVDPKNKAGLCDNISTAISDEREETINRPDGTNSNANENKLIFDESQKTLNDLLNETEKRTHYVTKLSHNERPKSRLWPSSKIEERDIRSTRVKKTEETGRHREDMGVSTSEQLKNEIIKLEVLFDEINKKLDTTEKLRLPPMETDDVPTVCGNVNEMSNSELKIEPVHKFDASKNTEPNGWRGASMRTINSLVGAARLIPTYFLPNEDWKGKVKKIISGGGDEKEKGFGKKENVDDGKKVRERKSPQTGNVWKELVESGFDYLNWSGTVMSPPPYSDLGKQAKDVFGKGYHFGLLKLNVTTKTDSGVEFVSGCTSNQDSGKVFGNLETKYKIKDYGMTFTEKWNTDNVLATELAVQDQIAQGLKLSLDGTFAPQTGSKSAHVKAAYVHDICALNADVDVTGGPLITASAVLGYQGFTGGYQTKFDIESSKITANNFALGFSTDDFILHTNVNDGQDFGGAIFQKVTPELGAAIDLSWSSGSNETSFGIGGTYKLDDGASVRAKVNNASQVGLGYQQKLREGVTITLSSLIDAKNFNQGGHKIGLALDLDA